MGAELIIMPTANVKSEPLDMFEWEIRVQAMQNQVFIAMCNLVGSEDNMDFAAESILVHSSGDAIYKANDDEMLIVQDIDLSEVVVSVKTYYNPNSSKLNIINLKSIFRGIIIISLIKLLSLQYVHHY